MASLVTRSPILEHKGLDHELPQAWDKAISCTLPGCSHPIVEPILLGCRHSHASHGKINAVYNRACLMKAMFENSKEDLLGDLYCPGCKRAIMVLKPSQYKNHPILKEIARHSTTSEFALSKEKFDREIQLLSDTNIHLFNSCKSILTPTPLEITNDRKVTELDEAGLHQRVSKLCSFHIFSNTKTSRSVNYSVGYSIQSGKRFIYCVQRNFKFTLILNASNRVSLEEISHTTWEEYRDWVLSSSTISNEIRYYLYPQMKTVLKVGSFFSIIAGLSFALSPYQMLQTTVAVFAVLKAYPYISKLFSRN